MNILRLIFLCVFVFSAVVGQTDSAVVLLFAGDVTLARHIETAVGEKTEYIFARWDPVRPYDIFMVNLENPLTTWNEKVEKEFNFKMLPKYLRTLQHGGINIVNAANNHIADYGLTGIDDTIRYLDSAGISYVGIGKNLREARKPVMKTVKGRTFGFLGYHGGDNFAATANTAGIAPRFLSFIIEDVKKLKKKADYVVVNFHWGSELAEYPEQWQVDLAHRVVDAGANLIVGHHPHVLQGIERYHDATIAYSLGNFIFGGNAKHTYDTAVLRVIVAGEQTLYEVVPVSVVQWQPRLADAHNAANVLSLVQQRSTIFRQSILPNSAVFKIVIE